MVKLELDDSLDRWISERLQAWTFPDRSEQDFITDTISMIETSIASIAPQISATKQKLEELTKQQKSLTVRLAGCKSLLAPIRKLPADILLEIFRLCEDFETAVKLHMHWADNRGITSWRRSGNDLPAVCSAWNTLIVNTASFWSKISVSMDFLEQTKLSVESVAMIAELLRTVLQRSKGAPLDIAISVWPIWALASTVVKPLLEEVHRWKHLSLSLCAQQYLDHGFRVFEDGLSSLETLYLDTSDASELEDEPIGHSTWFRSVPRLRELEQFDIPFGLLDIPWSQIQKLTARSYDDLQPSQLYVEALKAATHLQSLTLLVRQDSHIPSQNPIPLPRVTSLITETHRGMELTRILTFPHLTELVLDVHGTDTDGAVLLSSVSRTLQRLTLDDPYAKLFLVTFCEPGLRFPELTHLSMTIQTRERESHKEACMTSALCQRFPVLTQFSCSVRRGARDSEELFKLLYQRWLTPVFHWMAHSTKPGISSPSPRRVKTVLVFDFYPDGCIPILRDIASTGTNVTFLDGGRKIELEDHLRERGLQDFLA